MSDGSKIEWLARTGTKPATWNPIRARVWNIQNDGSGKECIGWHCTHVSEGCRNCYAERINLRLGTQRPYRPSELFREDKIGYRNGEVKVFLDENTLTKPLHWRAPRTIFVCSTSDIFGDWVTDDIIDRVFAIAALCPQHTFILLTKRAQRMREYFDTKTDNREESIGEETLRISGGTHCGIIELPLPNVWLGVSAENQKTADERIPLLLATPAAIRFVSCEPMLGAIDLQSIRDPNTFPGCLRKDVLQGREYHEDDGDQWTKARSLNWVICGGESGPNARPMHPDWALSLLDQCTAAGIPFFFKQWGEWLGYGASGYPDPESCNDGLPRAPSAEFEFPDGEIVFHVGRATSGDRIDGVQHHAWPEVK